MRTRPTCYYRQSDNTADNASSTRPVSQIYSTTPYVYEWTAGFVSGAKHAGLYFFASDADSVHHGNAYFVDQKGNDIRIFEVTNNNLALRRQSGAATSNGESHDYKVTYDPNAGWIFVYRDGNYITGWQDPTPLTSGNYVALRTHNSDIKFDDVQVDWTWLSYFHTDHLGSGRAMSDEEGNLVDGSTTRFLPFGDWRTEPAVELTGRGFTGHRQNDELGLIYMNARYYVSGIGRFASADALVPSPENPQTFNRYSYVNNIPMNYVDPSGHFGICFQQGNTDQNEIDKTSETAGTALGQLCSALDAQGIFGAGSFQIFGNDAWGIIAAINWLIEMMEEYPDDPIWIVGYSWGGGGALDFVSILNELGGENLGYLPFLPGGVVVPEGVTIDGLILVDAVTDLRIEIQTGFANDHDSIPENVEFALNLFATEDVYFDTVFDAGLQYLEGALNVEMEGTNHCSIGYASCQPSWSYLGAPHHGGVTNPINMQTLYVIYNYLIPLYSGPPPI